MRINLLVVLALVSCSVFGQHPEIVPGEGVTRDNFATLSSSSIPFSVARSAHRATNEGTVQAYFYDQPNDRVFSISENVLLVTNYTSRQLIGSWPVDVFIDPDLEPEITQVYAQTNTIPEARSADNLSPILGCFFQRPLRYGDINKDGVSELIIFAQDEFGALNFNVFSPIKNEIAFSVRLATYDAKVNDRLSLQEGQVESASDPLADAPTDGQYLSKIVEERTRMIRGIQPALINLALRKN